MYRAVGAGAAGAAAAGPKFGRRTRAHTYGVKRMTQSWSAASCTASHPPNFGAMAELRAFAKQFESFPFHLDRRARIGIFALSGVICPVICYILCCYSRKITITA